MPKELLHWWLADEALRSLPFGNPVRQLLSDRQAAYLVGAVLPDTLLHLVGGRWSPVALAAAQRFHEPCGNSYTPLVQYAVLQQRHAPLQPATIACLLGIAAHMEADIVFHPFVCSLAHDDIGRHYAIETELDLWLLGTGRRPPLTRLRSVLTPAAVELAIAGMQGVFDPAGVLPESALRQALRLHALLQGMYGSPGWQLLANTLALLPHPFLRSRHRLFYPLRWRHGQAIDWARHAPSGNPEDLVEKALKRITGLLLAVEKVGLLDALRGQPGENLITGKPFLAEDHEAGRTPGARHTATAT